MFNWVSKHLSLGLPLSALTHASQCNVCEAFLVKENEVRERNHATTHGRVGQNNVPTCNTALLPASVLWAPGRVRWWTTGYSPCTCRAWKQARCSIMMLPRQQSWPWPQVQPLPESPSPGTALRGLADCSWFPPCLRAGVHGAGHPWRQG